MPNFENTELIRLLNANYIRLPANLGVRVYASQAQAIGNANWEAIDFDAERWDTGITNSYANGFWDAGVSQQRLTAVKAGFYCISGHIEFSGSDPTGFRGVAIALNVGATFIASDLRDAVKSAVTMVSISTDPYWLNVGDYVRLLVRQSSAGNLNVNSSGNYSPEFGMVRTP